MTKGHDKVLAFRGLTKRFGGVVALDHFDMEVDEGQIMGLIGPNGSGKTTSFNVLTGIYEATGGTIEFLGQDITNWTAQKVCEAGVARTFQRSRLCVELSIFDNIMIGNHQNLNHGLMYNIFQRKALKRDLQESFEQAKELMAIFNPPLAGRMMEPVRNFGMIDRRRIEICRALISHPRLLLLDEPSAGMTEDETRQLMDDILVVRDKIKGLSIILVEHEMGMIERVTDRCVVLNFGQKICEGAYREVASDKLVQEAYLGVE
ncbi:MAG: ABC transporter ATP-binding protein [Magnetovibrio sp.]|nr:ABC transporter ATP-binding protein [Magnetovibrio sp.]